MKIAITGASGFVGTAIQRYFKQNEYVHIHRDEDVAQIVQKLKGVDIVINLAGAPIIHRWDDAYKKVLRSSRIDTTQTLIEAINQSDVAYLISTSAVGIYPNDVPCDETSQIGDDFLAQLTKEWEETILACNKPTAILRFGVIFGKNGGALTTMLPAFKFGLGGVIGNGKMMTSWIALGDLMKIYGFLFEKRLTGIFNACAPNPVTNRVFTKALGSVLKRPTLLPLPTFLLKIYYGEGAKVITDSKEVRPKKLQELGFEFDYPDITSALRAAV
ncbi:MAG: TIGR01777 family oxidoreductase [Sulfurovaceae bacterium]